MDFSSRCRMCGGISEEICSVSLLDTSQPQLQWIVQNFDIKLDDGLPTRICMPCYTSIKEHCIFISRSEKANDLFAHILATLELSNESVYPDNEASTELSNDDFVHPDNEASELSNDEFVYPGNGASTELSNDESMCHDNETATELSNDEFVYPDNEVSTEFSNDEPMCHGNAAPTTCKPTTSCHSTTVPIRQSPIMLGDEVWSDDEHESQSISLSYSDLVKKFNLKEFSVCVANLSDNDIKIIRRKLKNKQSKEQDGILDGEQVPVSGGVKENLNTRKPQANTGTKRKLRKQKSVNSAFVCDVCGEQFNHEYGRNLHIGLKHKDHVQQFKCNDCDAVFPKRYILNVHYITNHGKYLNCALCNYKTQNKYRFKLHIKRRHFSKESLSSNKFKLQKSKYITGKFICEICNLSFKTKSHLAKHKIVVHNKYSMSMKAKNCLTKYKHHNNRSIYKCPDCDKSFHYNSLLQRHSIIHIHDTNMKCDKCGQKFKYKTNWIKHLKMSHEAVCNLCHKPFISERSLKYHKIRVHSQIISKLKYKAVNKTKIQVNTIHKKLYRFKCIKCSTPLKCKSHLKRHMLYKHNNIRPFKCHICIYSSKDKFDLKRHLCTHDK